jgi:hypothetical protein
LVVQTIIGAGLGLSTAGVWGASDFAGGIASKRANVFRVIAVANACGFLFMLLLAVITREPFPPMVSLGWGAFAGMIEALGIAALYRGLAIGRMGVVAPVAAVLTSVLPVLVGIAT